MKNLHTLQHFSPREAYAAYVRGNGVLVDVRDNVQPDARFVDVKQVVQIPFSELSKRFGELPANRTVVFVSRIGNKSTEAAKFMIEHGYEDVAIVEGGLDAWAEEGLPVRTKN